LTANYPDRIFNYRGVLKLERPHRPPTGAWRRSGLTTRYAAGFDGRQPAADGPSNSDENTRTTSRDAKQAIVRSNLQTSIGRA
jgi:hypothetical protein